MGSYLRGESPKRDKSPKPTTLISDVRVSHARQVDVLDCKTMTWMSAPGIVGGSPPAPREDAAWCFDKKTAKIFCHGGWANDWLDDMFTLDVSGIVGPPYAVQSLEPNEGPMTGKTPVIIHGLDFTKGKIVVKFTDGRNEEISEKAEYLSPTEVRAALQSRVAL